MQPKIVFLLSSISQPRCIKRIKSFISAGFDIDIYGFDRGIYNVNSEISQFKINVLGFAPSGYGYLKKFMYASKVLKKLFREFKNENVIYYAFSFDIALICKLFGKQKYIYEISDLVYAYFNNEILRNVFKLSDRQIIKTSLLTVMTSKGFYEYLFPKTNQSKIIVQPNRVDHSFYSIKRRNSPIINNKWIFSYVGAFRYPNTVFRFARIIGEKYPQHEFHYYGDSNLTNQVKEMALIYRNIKYFGPFKSPEDLPDIYEKIDIIVACYDTTSLNERIAEPNKLYESLFFNKPIIVSNDTFLAKQVEKLGCGFIIDAHVDQSIIDFIESLSNDRISVIHNNISNLSLNEIIDDNGIEIINFINQTIKLQS